MLNLLTIRYFLLVDAKQHYKAVNIDSTNNILLFDPAVVKQK